MENYLSLSSFKPRNDNVLVRLDAAKEEPAWAGSLLVLPDNTKRRPIDGAWGTVVAVPDELHSFRRHCEKCSRPHDEYDDRIEVGSRVILDSETAGDAVLIDGAEHRIVRVAEILAVEDT